MKRLYVIAITAMLLAMIQPPRLLEASCTAGSVCVDNDYKRKGLREIGKVWYLTPFAETTPPQTESEVFGIAPTGMQRPLYALSETVSGILSCTQSVCIRDPDKPQCTEPGDSQGVPFQVRAAQFFLDTATTTCEVKGRKGTCKVLRYDHILNVPTGGKGGCPGGFVPDFSPDPFIGRTCTCDVSQGELTQDSNGRPICSDGSPATCLCMLVSGLPDTIGEPYANQAEIIDDGGTISEDDYEDLACTPNTLR